MGRELREQIGEVVMPFFEERQRCPLLIGAIVSGIVLFGVVLAVLTVQGKLEPPPMKQTLWSLWAIMALLDGFLASISMRTQILPEGIVVCCLPLRFLKRRIAWDEIERIYARTYRPLLEYGGWGIRRGKSGTAYNMRGNQGIQIELRNGRKILIGTQQPEAFLDAVRAAAGKLPGS